jgi:hypothetical protein
MTITRELYDAFQRVEIDRWDAIIAEDVLTNSPGALGIKGRAPLKAWAGAFASALAYQIDLVDEHLSPDASGNGRGFVTVNLHWKHAKEFMGLAPTRLRGSMSPTIPSTLRFICGTGVGRILTTGFPNQSSPVSTAAEDAGDNPTSRELERA